MRPATLVLLLLLALFAVTSLAAKPRKRWEKVSDKDWDRILNEPDEDEVPKPVKGDLPPDAPVINLGDMGGEGGSIDLSAMIRQQQEKEKQKDGFLKPVQVMMRPGKSKAELEALANIWKVGYRNNFVSVQALVVGDNSIGLFFQKASDYEKHKSYILEQPDVEYAVFGDKKDFGKYSILKNEL